MRRSNTTALGGKRGIKRKYSLFMTIRCNAAIRVDSSTKHHGRITDIRQFDHILKNACASVLGHRSPSIKPVALKIRKQLNSECGIDLKCWIRGTNRRHNDLRNLLLGNYHYHRG